MKFNQSVQRMPTTDPGPRRGKTSMSDLRPQPLSFPLGRVITHFLSGKSYRGEMLPQRTCYTRTSSVWPLPRPERLGQSCGKEPPLSPQGSVTDLEASEPPRPALPLALSASQPRVSPARSPLRKGPWAQ